jgi:hypothetical protein
MDIRDKEFFKSWQKFLHPEALKTNLITGALFLVAYELLREVIVGRLKDFYLSGIKNGKLIYSPEYNTEVLARAKNPTKASLLWLLENNVVDQADIDLVDRVCRHRHKIAHALLRFLAKANETIDLELLRSIFELISKVERWWLIEEEIATDPDFDPEMRANIIKDKVMSGNMMILHMMFQIVSAQGDEAMRFYNEWMKITEPAEA